MGRRARPPSKARRRFASRSRCPKAWLQRLAGRSWSTATGPEARTIPSSILVCPMTTPSARLPPDSASVWTGASPLSALHLCPWRFWATMEFSTARATAARPRRWVSWSTTSSIPALRATMPCKLRPICLPSRTALLASLPRGRSRPDPGRQQPRGPAVPARRDRSLGGRCYPSRARPHADVLRALGLGEFRPPALSRTAAHHDRPPHPARARYQGQLLGRANPAGLCLGGALQGCASARHRQFRTRSRGPATAGELQRVLRLLRQADRARHPLPARCNLRRTLRVHPESKRTRRDPRNAGDGGPRRDSDRVALAGTTAS